MACSRLLVRDSSSSCSSSRGLRMPRVCSSSSPILRRTFRVLGSELSPSTVPRSSAPCCEAAGEVGAYDGVGDPSRAAPAGSSSAKITSASSSGTACGRRSAGASQIRTSRSCKRLDSTSSLAIGSCNLRLHSAVCAYACLHASTCAYTRLCAPAHAFVCLHVPCVCLCASVFACVCLCVPSHT